jgi:hypothetical protein
MKKGDRISNYKFTVKITIGSLLILTSLFLFINNNVLTGFVTNSTDETILGILPIGTLFLGLAFMLSGRKDVLQARLEEMENDHPSPSLQKEENKSQTRKEKVHFGLRNLFGKRAVRIVEQKNRNYEKESDYQDRNDWYRGKEIREEEERRKIMEYQNEKAQRAYLESRKGIGKLTKFLRNPEMGSYKHRDIANSFANAFGDYEFMKKIRKAYIEKEDINTILKNINDLCAKQRIPFNKNRYQKLLEERLLGYHKLNFDSAKGDLLKYLTENSERVHEKELYDKIYDFIETSRLSGAPKDGVSGVPITMEQAADFYRNNTRTIPLKNVEQKYGVTFVSAIPYQGTRRAFGSNYDLTKNHGAGAPNLNYKDFLETQIKGGLTISASTVDKNAKDRDFFSPIGVILEKGKIYDASHLDLESRNLNNGRIAGMNRDDESIGLIKRKSPSEQSLEERVDGAINMDTSNNFNEFIIGDYSPKGIYFIRKGVGRFFHEVDEKDAPVFSYIGEKLSPILYRKTLKSSRYDALMGRMGNLNEGEKTDFREQREEVITNLSNIAKKYNLPLYEFVEGKGFIKI